MTTVASIFQTKLVSQMMIKTDQNKLENLTCFNDAIQSFLTLKCPTPLSELKEEEMKKLFLTRRTNTRGLKMTEEKVLPLKLHQQMVRLSSHLR